jgi:hypothetical protein
MTDPSPPSCSCTATERDSGRRDEVHIVTFPSEKNFDAYLQDPELTALGELRAKALRRTVVW